jgi:hypothetical protein
MREPSERVEFDDDDRPIGRFLTRREILVLLGRQVYAAAPYSSKGAQDVPNESDGIFGQSDGTTLLDARPSGDGYAATFSIALQTTRGR